ncbi:MAG: choice-of-anchor D domain-containing protein, partial [Betaproteobacteria bacterium]|nr:choice-of-anchor D domain-containing protein [Betaproteobacteria bacterium]
MAVPYQTNFQSVSYTGTQPLNYSTATVYVSNTGNHDANIISIQSSNPEFTLQTNGCPATLTPGQSCTLTYRFTPTSAGNKQSTASIYIQNGPWVAQSILTGQAFVPPGTLTLTSTPPNFGQQSYGTVAPSQTITVQNTGGQPVSVTSTTTSTVDYSVTGSTCPAEIAPGASCNISVDFIPYAVGTRPSTIVIKHNGSGGTTGVTVGGSGAGAPGLNFGSTNVVDVNLAGPANGVSGINMSGSTTPPPPAPPSGPSTPPSGPQTMERIVIGDYSIFRPFIFGGGAGGGGMGPLLTDFKPEGPDDPCLGQEGGSGPAAGEGTYSAPNQDLGANVPPTDPIHTADPIHAALGNKAHPQIDYRSTAAFNIEFSRTYHAQAPYASAYIKQNM